MTICDVCNAEAEGGTVPVREFQRSVAERIFDPVRLRLVDGLPVKSDEENFAFWAQVVRENDTDWFLCHRCHRAYLECTAAAAKPAHDSDSDDTLPDSLETLRRLHPMPAPPAVPANWQPGFFAGLFGPGKPWGDTEDALALLRHGRIAEGRELLQRIVAHSREWPQRLVLCLEKLRPPKFESFKPGTIISTLQPGDRAGLDAVFAFAAMDYGRLGEAMLHVTERMPTSEMGAFLLLSAVVTSGDLWLQTQILHPLNRSIESAIVVSSSKGCALLLERRHDEAWQVFTAGIANAGTSIENYRKTLGVDFSSDVAAKLARALRGYCEIGRGLVLFDLGFERERRVIFRRLAPTFSGSVVRACELLA